MGVNSEAEQRQMVAFAFVICFENTESTTRKYLALDCLFDLLPGQSVTLSRPLWAKGGPRGGGCGQPMGLS